MLRCQELKKTGGKPEYIEYKDVGHNSWDQAYGTAKLYDWLLEQKRKRERVPARGSLVRERGLLVGNALCGVPCL
jgi:hypothetical protein